jgi:hypothetical protein
MFGTSSTQRKDDDVVDVAAVLLTTRVKRHWGGFMPGHKTYKRKVSCLDTKHIIVNGKLLALSSIKITSLKYRCTLRIIFW